MGCPGIFDISDRFEKLYLSEVGFEAWTYPLLGWLFWLYQATDSGDNTLDYEAYVAGYVAAVAYHTQLSGRVNLWKGF